MSNQEHADNSFCGLRQDLAPSERFASWSSNAGDAIQRSFRDQHFASSCGEQRSFICDGSRGGNIQRPPSIRQTSSTSFWAQSRYVGSSLAWRWSQGHLMATQSASLLADVCSTGDSSIVKRCDALDLICHFVY